MSLGMLFCVGGYKFKTFLTVHVMTLNSESQDLNLCSVRYFLSLCPSTEIYEVMCKKNVQLSCIIVFLLNDWVL